MTEPYDSESSLTPYESERRVQRSLHYSFGSHGGRQERRTHGEKEEFGHFHYRRLSAASSIQRQFTDRGQQTTNLPTDVSSNRGEHRSCIVSDDALRICGNSSSQAQTEASSSAQELATVNEVPRVSPPVRYTGISETTIALLGEIDYLHRRGERKSKSRKRSRHDSVKSSMKSSPDPNSRRDDTMDDEPNPASDKQADVQLQQRLERMEEKIDKLTEYVSVFSYGSQQRYDPVSQKTPQRETAEDRNTGSVNTDEVETSVPNSSFSSSSASTHQRSQREEYLERYTQELRNIIRDLISENAQMRTQRERAEELNKENEELRNACNQLYLIYRCVTQSGS
eukprot:gb/GECG01001395.1/.p1 GENE.gb/GECG01001395.1/~~gb/GECG01001395.1/.p1  ORF type:complete len:340 (+),score=46.06 gb/GECG01001395.1/:1-1020(+)